MGLVVIGAMMASMVSVNLVTVLNINGAQVVLQEIFDAICPKILPLGLTFACYWGLQKRYSGTVIMIALLVLGSPLWLPLLLTAIVLFFSIYVVLWSLIAALYAVDLSFAAGAVGGIGGAVSFFATGFPVQAFLFLGLGLLCAGITILLFFVFNRAALQIAKLGKTIVLWIKSWFLRKEETK